VFCVVLHVLSLCKYSFNDVCNCWTVVFVARLLFEFTEMYVCFVGFLHHFSTKLQNFYSGQWTQPCFLQTKPVLSYLLQLMITLWINQRWGKKSCYKEYLGCTRFKPGTSQKHSLTIWAIKWRKQKAKRCIHR